MMRELPEGMMERQLDIMKHAWGFSERQPGYRTHYSTEVMNPDMVWLVNMGYFQGPVGIGHVGDGCGICDNCGKEGAGPRNRLPAGWGAVTVCIEFGIDMADLRTAKRGEIKFACKGCVKKLKTAWTPWSQPKLNEFVPAVPAQVALGLDPTHV